MEIEEGEYYSLMNRENLKGGEKNHRSENPWKAPPPPPSSLPPGGGGDSVLCLHSFTRRSRRFLNFSFSSLPRPPFGK